MESSNSENNIICTEPSLPEKFIIDLSLSIEMKTALEAQTVPNKLSQNAYTGCNPSCWWGRQLGTQLELLNYVRKPNEQYYLFVRRPNEQH
jgi:hypothetical protein